MPEPRRLYTTFEIANALGVNRSWIHVHLRRQYKAPQPDFVAPSRGGKHMLNLWTEASVARWQAYHASTVAQPGAKRFSGYSDHNAVNKVGSLMVTWKLWWRPTPDGGTMWWLSTPDGWYTSDDDGRTWVRTGEAVRPGDYHYRCVNANVKPGTAVANVLATIAGVRDQIEGKVKT